jgi:Flp pilus assembly pilin Flp
LRNLSKNDRGATAIEYAIIAALLALGIVGSLMNTRGSLRFAYSSVSTGLSNGGDATGSSPLASGIFATRTVTIHKAEPQSWGQTKYSNIYSDGSSGFYYSAAVQNGNYYRPYVDLKDTQTGNYYSYNPATVNPITNQNVIGNLQVVIYYASGNVKSNSTYGFNPDGTTMTGNYNTYADTPQQTVTSSTSTTLQRSQYQSVYDQYEAYRANP